MKKRSEMSPFVIAIVGPTAVGKSDFAVALARKLKNAEIISADSRQVYRGLDIGSGKITRAEMKNVPHHLIDVADPIKVFSVVDFVKLAETAITDIAARRNIPIICGGTGLYVDTLLSGAKLPEVPPNAPLRKELSTKTAAELFIILTKIDPERAATIDAKNPVRLIRAIEIAKAIGKVPKIKSNFRWPVLYVGLDADDETLRSRIHDRLIKRIEIGMLDEVAKLHAPKNKGGYGVSWKRLEALGLEYKYCALVLQKKMSKTDMLEELETEIWHYAKRQRTWWKRNKEILWIE